MPDPTPTNDGTAVDPVDDVKTLKQEMENLQKQLAENNKRIAGQTRSWQEERAARETAEAAKAAAEAKLQRYSKYDGILSDLDDDSTKVHTPTPAPANDGISQQLNQVRLELIQTKYAANPNNREKAHIVADPKLKNMVLQEVGRLYSQEQAEYGRQQSSDDELFAKGVDEVAKFVDTLKADGAKIVEEERHNIPGNVNLGNRGKGQQAPNANADEEMPIFMEQTNESVKPVYDEYVSNKQDRQRKMRGGQ